jgi:integrase
MTITYKPEINTKPKKDGTCLIMLRITENRKKKRISTGVFVPFNSFNNEAKAENWIRKSNPNHKALNTEIVKFIEKVKEAKTNIEKNKQIVSAKSIINEVNNRNTGSFSEYFNTKLEYYLETNSAGYYKHLKSKLNNLNDFNNNILFTELDVTLLNNYEVHLKKKGLNDNSITSNLRAIRTILYEAYKENKYEGKNPFLSKKLKEFKTNKEKLSIEEIKKIEGLELEENSILWNVKNYFLFAYYAAGIRIGDCMQLQWKNIANDTLSYNMDKTDTKHEVVLIPKAKAIIELYKIKNSKSDNYIFPILKNELQKADKLTLNAAISSKNAAINLNLKKIALKAKIAKNLTFHISRHSFADILRQQDVSIYDIKDLLGHSDIKITQNYLKSFDRDSANKAHSKAVL